VPNANKIRFPLALGPSSAEVDKCVSQYVRHPGYGETVIIHVRESLERLDERDSTESFLDIDDVVRG